MDFADTSTYDFSDLGNEELRAELKALQYEMSTFKQEKEFTDLRHEKELREVQKRAEADFKRAQVPIDIPTNRQRRAVADIFTLGVRERQPCRITQT